MSWKYLAHADQTQLSTGLFTGRGLCLENM